VKTRHLLVVLLLALAVVLSGCSLLPGKAKPPQQVTIAMGFIPNVQFTPMYVAIEKGYFAAEGLEIALDYGMETDLLQRVGANQLQFAIASGDQVILARANDLPVKYVFSWYRRFPVCVVSLAERGIAQPQDLVDKTVGIPVTQGASYIGWLAFLDEVGIAPERVNLQAIGYTQMASLVEKRVDAAVCYAMNEPVQLKESGYDTRIFYLDQYTKLPSNGLITNDATIKDHPDLVQKVVRAFGKGLRDTLDDPDAAFAITRKTIAEMDEPTAKLQRAVLQECLNFWRADKLGQSDPAAWQESVAFLKELGLLTADVAPESLYTNQFIR